MPGGGRQHAVGRRWPHLRDEVDGDHLYLMGLAGNVACLRLEDGSWQRSMQDDVTAR